MTSAKEIMHTGVACIRDHETLTTAAQHMRDLDVGALPVCGDDHRLHGMITDRDIVIKCVAGGGDPSTTTAGELAQGTVYEVDADANISDMLTIMETHQVRRLPIVEGQRLVGIVSEADIAGHLPDHAVADFVKAICAPSTSGAHQSLTPATDSGA